MDNTAYAIALVDRLAEEGLRDAVICPGSRSTPLALALDTHPDITTTVHIDERGAAYFALGIARAAGRPAAVLTTSGTAVANLLPACAEAHQDNVPLLLLTADRPPRLRGTGANQAMDQVGLFSRFVRFEADLPLSGPAGSAQATMAMRQATAWPPGPVHLNQAFEKPLDPDAAGQAALRELASQRPRPRVPPLQPAPSGAVPDLEPRLLGPHGLIVCGPGTGGHLAPRIMRLAGEVGAPVLADALSGLRFGHDTIAAHDLFLGAPEPGTLRPHYVIQFGRSPTSNALRAYLGAQPCSRYRFDHSGRRWDDIGGDVTFVDADPARWLDRLLHPDAASREHAGMNDPAPWSDTWRRLDQHARQVAADALRDEPDAEAAWVPAVTEHARRVFVGNSMPVRDLDRFGAGPRALEVAANRGVSGIDGTIATAAGWAAANPGVAVIGDVAFQHDLGSLPLLRPGLRLVVVKNGGGRIFHHLPISQATDRFDRLFLTPPQVQIVAACRAFGLDAETTAPSGLAEALKGAAPVIVLEADGQASARWRQQVERRVHKGVGGVMHAADI